MRCLFLAPHGRSITTREQEEGYPPGHLSEWTEVNIRILERLRARLDQDAQQRLALATYDDPVRFQIVPIDDQLGIVQPYLPGVRGVDSPTFLLRRLPGREGLLPAFQQAFSWLSDHSSPVC